MANMFVDWGIDGKGITPKVGTAYITGGSQLGEGVGTRWFAISSFSWGARRLVSMDIGNGRNRDQGMVSMNEITFSREVDRASEYLLSRMYVPGYKGDDVNIIVTKPDREGKGTRAYLQVQLHDARIIDYCITVTEEDKPVESLAATYNKIIILHWNEEIGGELEKGGTVGYDLLTARSTSHAEVAGG